MPRRFWQYSVQEACTPEKNRWIATKTQTGEMIRSLCRTVLLNRTGEVTWMRGSRRRPRRKRQRQGQKRG